MSAIAPITATGAIGNFAGISDILALRQQIIQRSNLLQQVHTAPTATDLPSGGSFTDALQAALSGVNASQNRADALSSAYERGDTTDVAKVMLARQEASVGFETTLQVRNKLMSAYQDIMKLGV